MDKKEQLRKAILNRLRDDAVRNNLSVFTVVSDNDSPGGNSTYSAPANSKHNEAVRLARRNHMAWESAHGHDPHVGKLINKQAGLKKNIAALGIGAMSMFPSSISKAPTIAPKALVRSVAKAIPKAKHNGWTFRGKGNPTSEQIKQVSPRPKSPYIPEHGSNMLPSQKRFANLTEEGRVTELDRVRRLLIEADKDMSPLMQEKYRKKLLGQLPGEIAAERLGSPTPHRRLIHPEGVVEDFSGLGSPNPERFRPTIENYYRYPFKGLPKRKIEGFYQKPPPSSGAQGVYY
jgi:hypothetical protein